MRTIGLRGGFSDRKGLSNINHAIQMDELDERSRMALLNLSLHMLNMLWNSCNNYVERYFANLFCNVFIMDFVTAKDKASYWSSSSEIIRKAFLEESFFSIFDIIEHFIKYNWAEGVSSIEARDPRLFYCVNKTATELFNQLFERECIGYRLVEGQVTDITNPEEIDAISKASASKYAGASKHIKKAIDLLYNRENHDYANAIKESISAIEAICQIIVGDSSATLGQALKIVKDKVAIHPALSDAFSKIYGYTSDTGGIRHANGMDGPSATFEEAKFMLVSCSAFLNYIISAIK